ncbi:hypothetical protein FRB90_006847, partial [Tulasnella sp. 427]
MSYPNQVVYGHQFSAQPPLEQQRRSLFYPQTPEQQTSQQLPASSSAFPSSVFTPQPHHYYPQQPAAQLSNNSWSQPSIPASNIGNFEDISPAFKGKAFIYDCMVRALESLSQDGASVKDIFDHVWLNNRAFILARSRDGDTEASRRASTKNTIVNYLSTSPAFDSIGRNRWVLTGKRHGADKRGGKIARSAKRKPQNASYDDYGLTRAGPSSSSSHSSSSGSPSGSSAGNSSSSSPEIGSIPARPERATGQSRTNEAQTIHHGSSAPNANSTRSATTPLPLSNGLIQSSIQASSSATHHTHNPDVHHHQPLLARQEGPIVPALSSHAPPLNLGTSSSVPTGDSNNNNHPRRETFSYGQTVQRTASISSNSNVTSASGHATRRSFDAVPQVLPPRPPRTWHQDILVDPFATPLQTPTLAPVPKSALAAMVPPFMAPPPCQLFQIPSNTSYYETPSVSYPLHQQDSMLPPPSMTPSSSFYAPVSTMEELFAQVDSGHQQQQQVGGAGNSIPLAQQSHPHHQQHQQHH